MCLGCIWDIFGIILGYIPAACLQHSNSIPRAFLQHSYSTPAAFVSTCLTFLDNFKLSPSDPKAGPIKGGGGKSPAGRYQ